MNSKLDFKKVLENIAFSNQLMKAARFTHFTKISPEPLVLENEKCLLLAPHPDDETFGCGGLLLKYPDNFDVVCLSDGRCGGYLNSEEENMSIRKQEFLQAMELFGISRYKFLDIQDRKLIYNYEKFSVLEISDYDCIFLPSYFDQHKDHKAVTVLLQKLLKNKPHKPNVKIVFYELWAPLPQVNLVLDITEIMDKKKDVINIYKSQHQYVDFLRGITGLGQYRGMLSSIEYAEAYCEMDVERYFKSYKKTAHGRFLEFNIVFYSYLTATAVTTATQFFEGCFK